MRLKPHQISILLRSMELAFNPQGMQRLLIERFGLKMDNITGFSLMFSTQVVDIHSYFDQRNTTEELVAVLRDARPTEPGLLHLADELGFTRVPSSHALEVMVRKAGAPYQNAWDFRVALAKAEDTVCRVETQCGYGTGVLVGKRFVLTNHHVIATSLDDSGSLNGDVACLFDHKISEKAHAPVPRRVRVTGVPSCSPPADEDYQVSATATDPNRLDYALLELDADIGDEPIVSGGDMRGFITVSQDVRIPVVSDGLIILQHPLSQAMKIDIGAVTSQAGTRLRHSVNTDNGSSGAPVFDATLQLVALHHAGVDWPDAEIPYNQAVPLALIIAHAKSHGFAI